MMKEDTIMNSLITLKCLVHDLRAKTQIASLSILLLSLLIFNFSTYGTEVSPAQLSIIIENDSPFKIDQHYTSGNFVSYTPKDSHLNYTFGLEIYTPESHDSPVDVNDHPYAGWLYFTVGYNKLITQKFLSHSAFSIGTTGRNSFAHDIQNVVHEIFGRPKFKGWDSQVPSKTGYLMDYSLSYLITQPSTASTDLGLQASVTGFTQLGNIRTLFGIRPEIKVGYNIDPFSDKVNPNKDFKIYGYGNIAAIHVIKNYLLEGNNNRIIDGQSYNIQLENKVYQWTLGIALAFRNLDVKLYTTRTTEQFTTQAKEDRYAGIKTSWKF